VIEYTRCEEEFGYYAVEWKIGGDHHIDFQILNLNASEEDNVDAYGFLKYDGCMNWQTDPDCMAHFCDPEQAGNFMNAIKHVWTLGPNLKSWF